MPQHKVIQLVGIVILIAGAIPAAIGTSNMGLFIFYGAVAVAGALTIAYANKLRDRR